MNGKLPFPDFLSVTPCTVTIWSNELTVDGGPVPALEWSGDCWYSDKSKTVISKDKKEIVLQGSIQIKGDIAPGLPSVSSGEVKVSGGVFQIHRGIRPRNPDGTVHHTTLELF